ncbi:TRAP transporter small permease subunit [Sporosarcina sp. 179-K 3D1 HS]|uniref:TRAP transporter small permease n=1 Tax=Sporosarcina sp. 179-K 3D1 HS TaxID=3232169 RepID=UPI0039A1741E
MRALAKGIDFLLFLLVISLTIVIFLNIVLRSVYSLTWSGELAGIILMWIVYFGLVNSFYYEAHVRIDIIDEIIHSKKIKKVIQFIFYNIFGFVFGIYLSLFSYQLFQNYLQTSQLTVILRWPLYLIVLPFLLGGLLTSCYFLITIIRHLRVFIKGSNKASRQ